MGTGSMGGVLHYLRGLVRGPAAAQGDRELLDAFATGRDQGAFAALVGRHGPLVWGVCRKVLRDEQDAEDAFQATFLVLARKAGSVAWREDAGNWLYAVALRVARKARVRAARRRRRESEAVMPPPAVTDEGPDRDTAEAVAEEVGRLPDKYRRPVVLCALQGKSYAEAARLLGWPEGTVSGRLARARELLRRRLVRRGLALPAGGVAALLAADTTGAAVPAAVAAATVRAATPFAAGPGLTTAPAILAEEVMRAMSLSKLKVGGAVVLVLALIGAGLGAWARGRGEPPPPVPEPPPAERPREEEAAKPALPPAWAGRWVADPFAGAESIGVRQFHVAGGEPAVYRVTDPKKVADVVKAAKIVGIQNDMFLGCMAAVDFTLRRRDGTTFSASFSPGGGCLSCDTGTFTLADGFFPALERAVSDNSDKPVNLREFLPAAPGRFVKPAPVPDAKSLASGLKSLEITYLVGGQLHTTRIADEKTLDVLAKALVVLKAEALTNERAESGHMAIDCKDGASFYMQLPGGGALVDLKVGRFTVAPGFFDALNKEISRRAGFDIDVSADANPLPDRLRKQADKFLDMVKGAQVLRRTVKRDGKEETVVIDDPKEVADLVGRLRRAEAPPRELKLKKWDRSVELTLKDGKKVTLTFLHPGENSEEAESMSAMPVLSDLVDVSDFGQVWIDNQWQSRFNDLDFDHKRKDKDRRDRETSRLVCRDWPTFCNLVIAVGAHYEEDKSEIMGQLPAREVPGVLALLTAGKFEPLDWSDERWEKEERDLFDRGAGELLLAPGLGFDLSLVVSGEKELLVSRCGRVTFADGPIGKVQKAINPTDPEKVMLLPRPKVKE
jgi:RNA polymerase sigma factor (sigma-70 family)